MRQWILQPRSDGMIGLYDTSRGLQEDLAVTAFERLDCEIADRVVKALNEQESASGFFS